MASIPGSIPVTGFLAPTDSTDVYPVTDSLYGIDGLRNVPDFASRNSIPDERRREGMIVGVTGDDSYWRLKPGPWLGTNADWTIFIQSTSVVGGSGTSNRVLKWVNGPSGLAGDSYISDTGSTVSFIGPVVSIEQNLAFYTATGGTGVTGESTSKITAAEPWVIVSKEWVQYYTGGGTGATANLVTLPQGNMYTVPIGTTVNIANNFQYFIYGDLTINGNITNNGQLVILNGNLILGPSGSFDNYGALIIQQVQTGVDNRYVATFSTTAGVPFTITHNLGTLDFVYSVRLGLAELGVTLVRVDVNSVTITTDVDVTNARISMIAMY